MSVSIVQCKICGRPLNGELCFWRDENTPVCGDSLSDNDEHQKEDCKNGKHKFVECDEWERTCIHCGEFEK
jgi:hypothetical protein